MKKLSRGFALAVLLLAAPLAHAQPATEAQVDRLLEVVRAEETLDTVLAQMQAMQQQVLEQAMADGETDAEDRERIERSNARFNARVNEALSWGNMQPFYREIYTATFDADDINAMIEFYASPAGQNLLDKTPQLMENTMGAVQRVVMPLIQEFEQDIAAELGAGD